MVQVDSALPGMDVSVACIELVKCWSVLDKYLIPHEEQMPHSFVLNLMAEGLVMELTVESPKWLTLKEKQRLDDDGIIHR